MDAPDPSKIPPEDIIGCTALVVSGVYNGREFLRCGYYVSVNYEDEELIENPPEQIQLDKLVRTIIADKPRIFKIPIDWGIEGHGYEFPSAEEEAAANDHMREHFIKELTTNTFDENSSALSNFDGQKPPATEKASF